MLHFINYFYIKDIKNCKYMYIVISYGSFAVAEPDLQIRVGDLI